MKRTLAALLLAICVSGTVLAGDIPGSTAPDPPPQAHVSTALIQLVLFLLIRR
jgi:hypothetical protein